MKHVLIIGGSHGIGQALAQQLSHDQHKVHTACRTSTAFQHQSLDVTQEFELEIPETLDGLVYCPGSITLKPFHRITAADVLEEFRLNTLSAMTTIQQALPALKKAHAASIVLFSTVAVQLGLPYHVSISMAKGALEGMTRSLAAELAPAIRVNAIAPSLTDTPLAEPLLNSDAKKQAAIDRHPTKTVGQPDDLASLAAWLLSDSSQFVTGQIIHADGGLGSVKTI